MLTITRRLEFDAGHRIPNHLSQCFNLHGHRYVIEITLNGELQAIENSAECGMLMDFSAVKSLANEYLINQWDHAFLVFRDDIEIVRFLSTLPNHKTVVLDRIPTVENLVLRAFEILAPIFSNYYDRNLVLSRMRLYETPNCWAEVVSNGIPVSKNRGYF